MTVLARDPSDRTVRGGKMSPGMVSDTKAVHTHFTVTLQISWHGMTVRDIWQLFNIYCKCRTRPHTRVWHTTGTSNCPQAVRPVFTLLFNQRTMTVFHLSAWVRESSCCKCHVSCMTVSSLSLRWLLSRDDSALYSVESFVYTNLNYIHDFRASSNHFEIRHTLLLTQNQQRNGRTM